MELRADLVNLTSPSQAKIALFRSLFRGREDVYPRRFESRKTGKAGYAPACANEWVRGICEKPRIKCAECPNRRFLPVTDDVIRWHLSGYDAEGQPFVAGVYPLLQDETCFFFAVDFDKAGWREDATAFLEAARRLNLPAALERSRSGRGAHVWFFFEEAIPAALARRLGSHVLTETMEGRPDTAWIVRPPLSKSGHVAAGRLREPDRLPCRRAHGIRATACSWMTTWSRGETNGHGYLVLRFLAEDVGKELNLVLDAILRALSYRRASGSPRPPTNHCETSHVMTVPRANALQGKATPTMCEPARAWLCPNRRP